MYCFEQDMTCLIYHSLPDSVKSPAWFVILLLPEANLMLHAVSSCALLIQLHILFPLKLTRIMRSLACLTERKCFTIAEVNEMVGKIRSIQLLVSVFNIGHRNVIHCMQLICLAAATPNGYAAIALSGENPMFGLLALFVFFDAVFLYAFVYEKSFTIPDNLENLKRVLKRRLHYTNG